MRLTIWSKLARPNAATRHAIHFLQILLSDKYMDTTTTIALTLATLALVSGVAALIYGIRGSPSRGKTRCPQCRYELQGTYVCSECGHKARSKAQMLRRHRYPRCVALGLCLVCVSALTYTVIVVLSRPDGWPGALPAYASAEIAPRLLEIDPKLFDIYNQYIEGVAGESGGLGLNEGASHIVAIATATGKTMSHQQRMNAVWTLRELVIVDNNTIVVSQSCDWNRVGHFSVSTMPEAKNAAVALLDQATTDGLRRTLTSLVYADANTWAWSAGVLCGLLEASKPSDGSYLEPLLSSIGEGDENRIASICEFCQVIGKPATTKLIACIGSSKSTARHSIVRILGIEARTSVSARSTLLEYAIDSNKELRYDALAAVESNLKEHSELIEDVLIIIGRESPGDEILVQLFTSLWVCKSGSPAPEILEALHSLNDVVSLGALRLMHANMPLGIKPTAATEQALRRMLESASSKEKQGMILECLAKHRGSS